MVSAWKAIEQYLSDVERELNSYVDQRVPQLANRQEDIMLNTDMHMGTNNTGFISDEELFFERPLLVEVPNPSPEQSVLNEDTNYCDLDDTQLSMYSEPINHTKQNQYTTEQCYSYDNRVNVGSLDFRAVTVKTELCSSNPAPNFCAQDICNQAYDACLMDIRTTCSLLNIPMDPRSWTTEQVQQWIICQCNEFQVPQPNLTCFNLTGEQLCNLKEEYFRYYAPESFQTLLSRLDIWKNVNEQTTSMSQTVQQFTPQVTHIPVPRSPTLSPVQSGSLSPTSHYSDEDSQPNTPPYFKTEETDRLPEEPVNHHRQTIQLWQFLKLLLIDGHYTDCIRWVDRSRGIFKIENSTRVAKLWGKRKNRPAMNYDKLSRSIRQYYKKNIIRKTEHSKRLVYQFCQI